MPTKVVYDTDIGSDIDDAVSLAYLLAEPRCELLGITTVSGESARRAMLASALCRVAGRDVPILPGAELPLLARQRQPEAPQAARLPRWPHQTTFPSGTAVEFLRQTIRKHPGEVVLLATGPLTNVALLFSVDPEIPRLLKGFVTMCGDFLSPGRQAEWNAACDPHAAAIVYRTPIPVHRTIGLDVTMHVQMRKEDVKARFTAPILRPVLDFADVWFSATSHIVFHDPLAAAVIFDDSLCTFERGQIAVDLGTHHEPGFTEWLPGDGNNQPHEIAVSVSVQRFLDRYFDVVNGAMPSAR